MHIYGSAPLGFCYSVAMVFTQIQEQRIGEMTRQVKELQKIPKVKEVVTNDTQVQFRQRLTSIKGDYEHEINKLKDYLEKERNRLVYN